MSASFVTRRVRTVWLFCAIVVVIQLVLSVEAIERGKKYRSLRSEHNRGGRGNNRPHSNHISRAPYDYPRLSAAISDSSHRNRLSNEQYLSSQTGSTDFGRLGRRQQEQQQNPPRRSPVSVVEPQVPPVDTETSMRLGFDTRKQIRIEQIKMHILDQLNLSTAPNVTGVVESSNPEIQKLIDGVRERNNKMPLDSNYQQDMPDQFINDQKIFIPIEDTYPFDYKYNNSTEIMYFKMPEGDICRAVLHLWIKPAYSLTNSVLLSIYKVMKPVNENECVRVELKSSSWESVYDSKGLWTSIPVYRLASEWAKDPSENIGMMVEMKDNNMIQVAVTNSVEIPEKAPLLEVQFNQEINKSARPIRSSEGGLCVNGETKCCRYPLPINFTEHSFDFIVAPKVYMANFCNGKCGYLYAQQHIYSAVMQKLYNTTATYGPCCGAKKLVALNMLYYDHDRKIRFDIINDMVIEKCSCD